MICIAIPSRGRPAFLKRVIETASVTADHWEEVIVKYYLNDDDPDLKKYKKILQGLQTTHGPSVQWEIGPDQNTVQSWNMLCENTEADYYMLAGDEIQFVTEGWDTKVKQTKQDYPDGIFCMAVYDGRPNRAELLRCTQPIVTKEWRQALGYFWAPFLWHWHVDEYTGDLAKAVDRFVFREDIFIKIRKMKDRTAKRNRGRGVFDRDEWVYEKHKELYFDTDIKKLLDKMSK